MDKTLFFSSASEHWATDAKTYSALDSEFHFDYDPCPLRSESNGLLEPWLGKRVYCNPPYGPKIRAFLERGLEADVAVFLLPSRTDTRWFHEVVLPHAKEIRFVRGRLKFGDSKNSAPFPSVIVVFEKKRKSSI